jgi:hypothetical protein
MTKQFGPLTIISTAFPNVALISPPTVCPTLLANSSVAKESNAARGRIAKKLKMKPMESSHPWFPAVIPRNTNGRSRLE